MTTSWRTWVSGHANYLKEIIIRLLQQYNEVMHQHPSIHQGCSQPASHPCIGTYLVHFKITWPVFFPPPETLAPLHFPIESRRVRAHIQARLLKGTGVFSSYLLLVVGDRRTKRYRAEFFPSPIMGIKDSCVLLIEPIDWVWITCCIH